MFNRLEIEIRATVRSPAQVRVRVDGEDLVEAAAGPDGLGSYAPRLLPADGDGPLRATDRARRVELGEPECTGGCCGYLAATVRRYGELVVWSDWETPDDGPPLPDFHFDARQYDAELARATADRWWDAPPAP
ncbi:hypothetical protein K353_00534 [Kitasatospora sp. SolWspMP-SS2h]|uniref:hypothetical protein n=1 Tax=Kitasatospora sp. SolWspMP-SS2h TaxID=1305729 RepID=UPI000DBA5154|nr:hypothetical protein [Kitasatospora sp. SolWspMP-SS2h]RAJ46159.1 hypothetical protein K353_00534 [Kitasatospora sp. SolWspMP-SS2h]